MISQFPDPAELNSSNLSGDASFPLCVHIPLHRFKQANHGQSLGGVEGFDSCSQRASFYVHTKLLGLTSLVSSPSCYQQICPAMSAQVEDKKGPAYHELVRELDLACDADDLAHIRQLLTTTSFKRGDITGAFDEPQSVHVLLCLLEYGANADAIAASSCIYVLTLDHLKACAEFGYDIKSKGHEILQWATQRENANNPHNDVTETMLTPRKFWIGHSTKVPTSTTPTTNMSSTTVPPAGGLKITLSSC